MSIERRNRLSPLSVLIFGASGLAASGLMGGALVGCKKSDPVDVTAESILTEDNDDGSIAWDIEPDGRVHATIKGSDGHAITKNIAGTVTWPGDVADEERDLKLEDGALVASGPPLQDGLNEIDYALEVDGKVWQGALHVPGGGTRAVEDDAKAATAMAVPPGRVGPNGGNIQIIGGEPVEVVADRDSQEVRMYVLNRDYQVIEPGERSFRLGYGADYSGTEILVREPGAMYWVGPWYAGYNPYRVTIAMTYGGVTHVGIVGWHYGEALRVGWGPVGVGVGVGVPGVAFVGARSWAPSVAIRAGVGFGVGFGVGVGVGGRARVVAATAGRGEVHGGGRGGVGGHGEVGGHAGGGHEVAGRGGESGHGESGHGESGHGESGHGESGHGESGGHAEAGRGGPAEGSHAAEPRGGREPEKKPAAGRPAAPSHPASHPSGGRPTKKH